MAPQSEPKPVTTRQRVEHFFWVISATALWMLAMLILSPALWMVLRADRVWPDATHGNCWSFTIPRWWKYGGYFLGRDTDDAKIIAGRGRVPHISWVFELPESVGIQRTEPFNRYRGKWLLWRKLYFRFWVETFEHRHHLRSYKTFANPNQLELWPELSQ